MRFAAVLLMLITKPVLGDLATNGPDGINSIVTGLNGDNVLIGQAELGRSAKAGYDSANKSASGTSALSQLDFRVERLEFTAGVADFHLPVDAALGGVGVG